MGNDTTLQQDKQVTVDVPADRLPEFYAFFARFLAADGPGGRRRRGPRGRGPGGHRGGPRHGHCHHPGHPAHSQHDHPAPEDAPAGPPAAA